MQVSEILRKIADVVDQAEAVEQQAQAPAVQPEAPEGEVTAQVTAVSGELAPVDANGQCCDEPGTMVSPLQQEHELLKKSQGVDNNVSEFADDEGYNDELESMKQMAGIGEEQANAKANAEQRQMEDQLNPRRNAAIAMQKARSDRSS